MRALYPTMALACLSISVGQPVQAQVADPSNEKNATVSGDEAGELKDAADSEPTTTVVISAEQGDSKEVILGSRLPQRQLFKSSSVATSTGVAGLTPGSGMDPSGQYSRSIKTKTCVAEDERIGKAVACRLISARKEIDARNWSVARALLLSVSDDLQNNPYERRAAADYLFELGGLSSEDSVKLEALNAMISTGTLEPSQVAQAYRSMSTLSLKSGDVANAIAYLEAATKVDPNHAQSYANLAILKRQRGESDAVTSMRRAIAIAIENEQAIPEAWITFIEG